ncbi:hypothetical protein [Spirosoma pollinicola]|uniref:Uncharacterized protein n=1 Tax=Spirosoma pollinicola TaxID=2057025 RepID=A0A2K8Z411_9BACT|nr:hypothetical protein [Spirosoma pollinicola]AUD04603.1 hypothetical protein CWM47_23795 [Spirosoma pollinicola]
MKTLNTTEPTQVPPFWTEEWLDAAIKELDIRALTPENRLAYEMTLSANALAIENEQKKVEEVKNQEKEVFVINLLQQTDFDSIKTATIAGVPTEFVEGVKQKLALDE